MKQYIKDISRAVSEKRLFQTVADISNYHRIQSSCGFHEAAVYCSTKLNDLSINNEILKYPASHDVIFGTYPSFEQWDCKNAYCGMTYPENRMLADFRGNNISVIQKSIGCDYRNTPLDVVMLDLGADESLYETVDMKGKVVFVRGHINSFMWAVEKRGAIGFITDHIAEVKGTRERYDLLDVCTYTSFWPAKGEKSVFGFVLSPREGDRLAQDCRNAEKEGKCVQICCYIDAKFHEGKVENVSAFLPGETDEEVIIAAHLCHPRSSANDNASGVSAGIEALNVINTLIKQEVLPPLKRGIRLLLIPEFTGTYAWLSENMDRRQNIVAGINADMVGGSQSHGAGPLTITDLPKAMPSFVCDLAGFILEEIKDDAFDHNGDPIGMFNSRIASFSGGSDHVVFTDPKIGVPMLMLGQWPDKYYHTDHDTIDKIDPKLLSKSARLMASYVYLLANMEVKYIEPIGDFMISRAVGDMIHLKEKTFGKARCRYAIAYYEKCIKSFADFIDTDDRGKIEQIIKKLHIITETMIDGQKEQPLPEIDTEKYGYVPMRTHHTLVQPNSLRGFFSEEQKASLDNYKKDWSEKVGFSVEHIIDYYVDGYRTMAEIIKRTALETGNTEYEAFDAYIKMLCSLGYVEIRQRSTEKI